MPERITDQRHIVFAWDSLVRQECASAKWLNTQRVKEVRSDDVGRWRDRPVQRRKGSIAVGKCGHALEASAVFTPVEEEGGCGQSAAVASLPAEVRPDDREP